MQRHFSPMISETRIPVETAVSTIKRTVAGRTDRRSRYWSSVRIRRSRLGRFLPTEVLAVGFRSSQYPQSPAFVKTDEITACNPFLVHHESPSASLVFKNA